MLDNEILLKTSQCLKIMAHPVRLKVAEILSSGERNVKDLSETCGIPHNQICEHLRLMQHCGLIKSRKQGHYVYYSLQGKKLMSLLNCVRKNF